MLLTLPIFQMRTLLFLLAAAVVGCAPSDPAPSPAGVADSAGVPEMAPAVAPSQTALEEELFAMYGTGDGEVRYFSSEFDLNGDGQPETIAHVVGPLICGSGGCNTLVFTPDGDGLRLVTDVSVSRPPIVAAEAQTNGWRDLIVDVSGGGAEGGRARLPFDGTTYPSNPTVEPAQPVDGEVEGTVLIESFDSFADGELLRPGS